MFLGFQVQIRRQAKLAFGRRCHFSSSGSFNHARVYSDKATKCFLHRPPASTPREVPTPVVFVSSSAWDPDSAAGLRDFAAVFAEKGFTCLEVDLSPPKVAHTARELMSGFKSELGRHIRLAMIPFAPVIVARSTGCLITQTYISSHAAAALLLISPPTSTSDVKDGLLPTPLSEFTFEPKFPIGILDTEKGMRRQETHNRLVSEGDVALLVSRDQDSQHALGIIEQWMDDLGI